MRKVSEALDQLNNKLSVASDELLIGKIDDEDYYAIKAELKPQIEKLEKQLETRMSNHSTINIEKQLNKALSAVCNISGFYEESSTENEKINN